MVETSKHLAQLRRRLTIVAASRIGGAAATNALPGRAAAFAGVLLISAGAFWPIAVPSPARAQVMEIDENGSVTTYDRPAVFTAQGVTPTTPSPARVRRHGAAAVTGDMGLIGQAAAGQALSPALVEAVAWRESGRRADAVSAAGAIGQMQLMPATARFLGVDPRDPGQNYQGGAVFLRLMMNRYDGDLTRALAAYNAGPAAVDRYHGVPPYRETQAYVAAIMDRLSRQAVPPARKGETR